MTFTVVWEPSAERALARIWTDAADRRAVTQAADTIERLLRTAPAEVGESRLANTRILVALPLAVYYDVRHEDRTVAVWAVWRVGRR